MLLIIVAKRVGFCFLSRRCNLDGAHSTMVPFRFITPQQMFDEQVHSDHTCVRDEAGGR